MIICNRRSGSVSKNRCSGLNRSILDKPSWYAIWTRSRHEEIVKSQLENKAFRVFLPKLNTMSIRKDRRKIVAKPLFPSYLFINTRLNSEINLDIVRTIGVVKILSYKNGCAVPVPDYEINSIRILLSSNKIVEAWPYLKEGQMVRVMNGSLEGVVGKIIECRGRHRLVISVDLFARSISVVLERCDVLPYSPINHILY